MKLSLAQKVFAMMNGDTVMEQYVKSLEQIEQFIKTSRLKGVEKNYWALREQCLRRKEFDEVQARKNAA